MKAALGGLWQKPDFMKLWVGQTVSVFGNQISFVAWPLTAVLLLNATPAQMGIMGICGTLPGLLLSLFAGVWVDRLRRRPIMIAANLSLAVVIGSIPLMDWLQMLTIEYLYVADFLVGTFNVLFNIAYHSYLSSLVTKEELVEGNSKLEVSNSVAAIAGPGLAGTMVQLVSAPFAILVDALSFLLCVGSLTLIHTPEPTSVREEKKGNIGAEIGEGLRAALANSILRAITLCTCTYNLFGFVGVTAYTLYVVKELGVSAAGIGLIYAVSSIGALLGALMAARVARRFGIGPVIVWGALLAGAVFIFVPLAGGPMFLIIVVLASNRFIGSVGGVIYIVNQVSLRQAITPTHLQGRVTASIGFLTQGTMPLGFFLGGLLGENIGLRNTLWVGALGTILCVLWVYFSPVRSLREVPALEEFDKALVS
jgi:MFS family permease